MFSKSLRTGGKTTVIIMLIFLVMLATQIVSAQEIPGLSLWKYFLPAEQNPPKSNFNTGPPTYFNNAITFGTTTGLLFAVDSLTGNQIWMSSGTTIAGIQYSATWSKPVFVESANMVVIASVGTDFAVYGFSATNGALSWKFQSLGLIQSSIIQGTVSGTQVILFGSLDGYLYALDASNGELKWKYNTQTNVNISSTISCAPGYDPATQIVVIGTNQAFVHGVNAQTGTKVWSVTVGGSVNEAAIAVISSQAMVVIVTDPNIYFLNINTGEGMITPQQISSQSGISVVDSSSANLVFFSNSMGLLSGYLVAAPATFILKLTFIMGNSANTMVPLIQDEYIVQGNEPPKSATPVIYATASSGSVATLYKLIVNPDSTTPTILWSAPLSSGVLGFSSPASDGNGTVFVSSVYASAGPAQVYAFASCFSYNSQVPGRAGMFCPMSCRAANGGSCPGCTAITGSTLCNSVAALGAGCEFCPTQNICAYAADQCSCFNFDHNTCDAAAKAAPGSCQFCATQNLCTPFANCSCLNYQETQCDTTNSNCHWCGGVCDSLETNPACLCRKWDPYYCSKASSSCSWCTTIDVCSSTSKNPQCSCYYYNDAADCPSGCEWCGSLGQGVCAPPSAKCNCFNFPANVCQRSTLTDACYYCPSVELCSSDKTCSCRAFGDYGGSALCSNASNECTFCPNINMCQVRTASPACSCFHYNADQSSCPAEPYCNWCPSQNICAPYTGVVADRCDCNTYPSTICDEATENSCFWCGRITNDQQSVCAKADNPTCSCEDYPKEVCIASAWPGCTYCPAMNLCTQSAAQCDCNALSQTQCGSAQGCSWCPDLEICRNVSTQPACECYYFRTENCCPGSQCHWCGGDQNVCSSSSTCNCYEHGEFTCKLASLFGGCAWCGAELGVCVTHSTSHDECDCNYLEETACGKGNQATCAWCPEIGFCRNIANSLAPSSSNQQQCTCYYLDEPMCDSTTVQQIGACYFCGASVKQHICVPVENQACNCNNYTDTRDCGLANPGCQWCSTLDGPNGGVCVDNSTNPKCSCNFLDAAACGLASDSCTWCSSQQMCADSSQLPVCSCNYYAEDVCFAASGCHWCPEMQLCDFKNNSACSCEYLTQPFCEQVHAKKPNGKNVCNYCPEIGLCAQSENNTQCNCQYFSEATCMIGNQNYSSGNNNICHWCSNGKFCDNKNNSQCSCQYLVEPICKSLPFNKTVKNNNLAYCEWCDAGDNEWHHGVTMNICMETAVSPYDPTVLGASRCHCAFVDQTICQYEAVPVGGRPFSSCSTWCGGNGLAEQEINNNNNFLPAFGPANSGGTVNICIDSKATASCKCENFDELQCLRASGACTWCNNFFSNSSICVPTGNSCSCHAFTQEICNQPWSGCNWCENQKLCVFSAINPNCDCYHHNSTMCTDKVTNDFCTWCDTTGTCVRASGYPKNCNCLALDSRPCFFYAELQGKCIWCPYQGVCIDPKLTSPPASCTCAAFTSYEAACDVASQQSNLAPCEWQPPISTLGKAATGYCADSTACSPVTCEAIADQATCNAAQCQWISDSCESTECFNYFLPLFVSQSYYLLFLGCLKDICVLLFIGAYGDYFGRKLALFKYKIQRWLKTGIYGKYPTENRLMETVYMGDAILRDCIVDGINLATGEILTEKEQLQWSARRQAKTNNNDDDDVYPTGGEGTNLLNNDLFNRNNNNNKHQEKFYQYCFEDYVELVLDKLFDISQLGAETRPLYVGKLFDSVAFALVDNKRWVEVDDGCDFVDDDEFENEIVVVNNNKNNNNNIHNSSSTSTGGGGGKGGRGGANGNNNNPVDSLSSLHVVNNNNNNNAPPLPHDDHYTQSAWGPAGDSPLSTQQFYYKGSPEYEKSKRKIQRSTVASAVQSVQDITSAANSQINLNGNNDSNYQELEYGSISGQNNNNNNNQNFSIRSSTTSNAHQRHNNHNIPGSSKSSKRFGGLGGTKYSAARLEDTNDNGDHAHNNNAAVNNENQQGVEKLIMKDDFFAEGMVKLQKRVSEMVLKNASYAIYYAQSRSRRKRIASAINIFPSVPQLMFYMSGVMLMFFFALHSVLSQEKTVRDIANGCARSNTTTTTTSSSSSFHQYTRNKDHSLFPSTNAGNGIDTFASVFDLHSQQQNEDQRELIFGNGAPTTTTSTVTSTTTKASSSSTTSPRTTSSSAEVPTTTHAAIINPSTPVPAPNPGNQAGVATSLSTASYFLIGFRILNASTFATSILVFVKVLRGVWQRFFEDRSLTIQEKVPVMAVFTNPTMQVLLTLYFVLVSPFALCGVFYGPHVGWQPIVPIGIAIGFLILSFAGLKLSRWIEQRRTSNINIDYDDDDSDYSNNSGDVSDGEDVETDKKNIDKKPKLQSTDSFDVIESNEVFTDQHLQEDNNNNDDDDLQNNNNDNLSDGDHNEKDPISQKSFMSSASNNNNHKGAKNNKKQPQEENQASKNKNKNKSNKQNMSPPSSTFGTTAKRKSLALPNDSFSSKQNNYRSELSTVGDAEEAAEKNNLLGTPSPHSKGINHDDDNDANNDDNNTNNNFFTPKQQAAIDAELAKTVNTSKNNSRRVKQQKSPLVGHNLIKSKQSAASASVAGQTTSLYSGSTRYNNALQSVQRYYSTRTARSMGGRSSNRNQGDYYAPQDFTAHDDAASTLNAADPTDIVKALIVFIFSQELPTLIITIALQLAFNYTALLQYAKDYGLEDDPYRVFIIDKNARRWVCMLRMLEGDVSAVSSDLSSIMPFL